MKQLIDENSEAKINNGTLRKHGFNPLLVRRYPEFAADALGQEVGENGQYQLKQVRAPIVMAPAHSTMPEDDEDLGYEDEEKEENDEALEDDEIEVEEAAESAPLKVEQPVAPIKPRFDAPKRDENGVWAVQFEYNGEYYV